MSSNDVDEGSVTVNDLPMTFKVNILLICNYSVKLLF